MRDDITLGGTFIFEQYLCGRLRICRKNSLGIVDLDRYEFCRCTKWRNPSRSRSYPRRKSLQHIQRKRCLDCDTPWQSSLRRGEINTTILTSKWISFAVCPLEIGFLKISSWWNLCNNISIGCACFTVVANCDEMT